MVQTIINNVLRMELSTNGVIVIIVSVIFTAKN